MYDKKTSVQSYYSPKTNNIYTYIVLAMLYITLVSPSLTFKCIDKLEDILLWKKTKKSLKKQTPIVTN